MITERHQMDKKAFKYSGLLLITAAIWGFAFVAQRVGAQYVGAFTFNGVRFALGSLSLIPLLLHFSKQPAEKKEVFYNASPVVPGILAGAVLFCASSLQQSGLSETTAGKAAFITGLYIVIVPFIGIFFKQRSGRFVWIGALSAIIGLFLLSVTDSFTISGGDMLELSCAVLFSFHILIIGHYSRKIDAIKLSFVQFLTCSVLSMTAALLFEKVSIYNIMQAIIPILYGGIFSVGIAYTLQVICQKHTKASHAAIIMSMETVFAAIGGIVLLNESMGARGYIGCILMLAGMLLSQMDRKKAL